MSVDKYNGEFIIHRTIRGRGGGGTNFVSSNPLGALIFFKGKDTSNLILRDKLLLILVVFFFHRAPSFLERREDINENGLLKCQNA